MAVFRVERTGDYTVMSNFHLKDKRLSLKAKGLLSQMLSLPDDWDYTLSGLSYINRESKDAIRSAVNELETAGYIRRRQTTDASGKFAANEYTIFERPIEGEPMLDKPLSENPITVNPSAVNPLPENPTQLNTNIGQIPKLEKLVATIRSREISACLVLQAQSQLKAIYKDNADTIIGNMDTSIFLGGKEPTTLKELAAVLGKETIDTYNTGESRGRETSHSLNYQKLGKELMSQDELPEYVYRRYHVGAVYLHLHRDLWPYD